jgi:hypothetical protein
MYEAMLAKASGRHVAGRAGRVPARAAEHADRDGHARAAAPALAQLDLSGLPDEITRELTGV